MAQQLLINGNFTQTISYLLEHLQELTVSGITDTQQVILLLNELNEAIGLCCDSEQTTKITLEEFINSPPKVITIVDYTHFPNPTPIVSYKQIRVTSPPIINTVTIKEAYLMNCGAYNPTDARYVKCMDCVNQWVSEHPDVKPVTANGCGCRLEPKKSTCQKNLDACILRKRRRL